MKEGAGIQKRKRRKRIRITNRSIHWNYSSPRICIVWPKGYDAGCVVDVPKDARNVQKVVEWSGGSVAKRRSCRIW